MLKFVDWLIIFALGGIGAVTASSMSYATWVGWVPAFIVMWGLIWWRWRSRKS